MNVFNWFNEAISTIIFALIFVTYAPLTSAASLPPAATGVVRNCFISGTRINTINGLLAIEKISEGDQVYAYDFRKKKLVVGRVTGLSHFASRQFGFLSLSTGEKLGVTPEHQFFLDKAVKFKQAKDLVIGDTLKELDPSATFRAVVTELPRFSGRSDVHHIHVDGYNNYFVEGILVRNK